MSPQPWLVIIGGPNGAGKTTFARVAASRLYLRYAAADLIADELGLGREGADAVRAGRLFTERVRVAVSHGESLLVESTLSGLVTRASSVAPEPRAIGSRLDSSMWTQWQLASGGSALGSRGVDIPFPTTTSAAVSGAAW